MKRSARPMRTPSNHSGTGMQSRGAAPPRLSKLDGMGRVRFFVFREITGHSLAFGIEVGWLLSKFLLADLEAELLDRRFIESWRRLKGLVDPGPEAAVDEKLLPQERHEVGEGPGELCPQLQELEK